MLKKTNYKNEVNMEVLMKHQDWNNKLLSLFIVSLRCIAEVTGAIYAVVSICSTDNVLSISFVERLL